jgi:hypothetical protein
MEKKHQAFKLILTYGSKQLKLDEANPLDNTTLYGLLFHHSKLIMNPDSQYYANHLPK